VDALELARGLGIAVAWDEMQQGRARYVRLAGRARQGRPLLLLRPDPRRQRLHWAAAHEIGEHLAARLFAAWGVAPAEASPPARERAASFLAGRLLLPTQWFLPDAEQSDWDLLCLHARFNTASHELIARRMLECRPSVVISIFDHGRLTFRRGNFSGRVPPPLAVEMDCQREVHHDGRPLRRGRVQAWPIHEPGWKREILRMEVEEWYEG